MKEELNLAISQTLNNVNERVVITRDMNNDVDLESFNCDSKAVHPMQFLNRVRDFNQFNNNSWEVKILKIIKCFKGSSAVWAEAHRTDRVNYQSFERAFRDKYWSEEEEVLRSKIMGSGNFGTNGSNVTMYVMKLYKEAKYLEPPLPFRSFACHISKHLPREIQITLMTREVMEITELEKILDIFQNIRDMELGRCV